MISVTSVIEDRPSTDLSVLKILNGHIPGMGYPIHFMFGCMVEFSGSADRMALFRVGPTYVGENNAR